MRLLNGVAVPPYDPKFISAAIEFVGRAQLQGREALICADLIRFLGAVQAGHYAIVDAEPGTSLPKAGTPIASVGGGQSGEAAVAPEAAAHA